MDSLIKSLFDDVKDCIGFYGIGKKKRESKKSATNFQQLAEWPCIKYLQLFLFKCVVHTIPLHENKMIIFHALSYSRLGEFLSLKKRLQNCYLNVFQDQGKFL